MKYMLDTNICIYIIKQKPISVLKRLQALKIDDVFISVITLAELEYGVEKSRKKEQNKLALAEFLAPIEVLPFDDMAAQKYGELRTLLESKGKPIGSLDMLIAAHALSRKLVLVTNNVKEFKRIPSIKIKNWV